MNKTVLITGASRGIGNEIAKVFAENNFRVVINYNKSEILAKNLEQELKAKGCDCVSIQADVSDEASVNNMLKKISKFTNNIDILVNNAGIALHKLFCDTTLSDWNRIFCTNMTGIFNCCTAIVPSMIKRKSGKIVNISSVCGMHGASMEVAYSASKGAVIGFTKALAKELGPSGITVNCVAPGLIDTEMNSNLTVEDTIELKYATPLGRFGTPREVAETVLFLASEKANFITGQIISPNGGLFC